MTYESKFPGQVTHSPTAPAASVLSRSMGRWRRAPPGAAAPIRGYRRPGEAKVPYPHKAQSAPLRVRMTVSKGIVPPGWPPGSTGHAQNFSFSGLLCLLYLPWLHRLILEVTIPVPHHPLGVLCHRQGASLETTTWPPIQALLHRDCVTRQASVSLSIEWA